MANPNPFLEAALIYARASFAVLPCHSVHLPDRHCTCGNPNCSDAGKHPRTQHGVKDATQDPTQIWNWWNRWPKANVAIATGSPSGVVVLDVDPRHGGDDSLRELEATYGPLPDTPHTLTPGPGRHFLFQHPGYRVPCRTNVLGHGLDIKADGGYIIAPPSRHKSGNTYYWEVCHELGDIELAPLPEWIRERLQPSLNLLTYDQGKKQGRKVRNHVSKASQEGGVLLLARCEAGEFPLPRESYRPERVQSLLGDSAVVDRVLALPEFAGAKRGAKFSCLLHPPDEHPSAAIMEPREGFPAYNYVCFHGGEEERRVWPLPNVFYALKTGKPVEMMPAPSLHTWTLHMLVEAGVLAAADMPKAPRLPDDAPEPVRILYRGVQALLSCKWLRNPWAPTALAHRFMSNWCGVSEHYIRDAMKWLLRRGYLIKAGMHEKMTLFRIGTRKLIDRLARKRKTPGDQRAEKQTQEQLNDTVSDEVAKLRAEIAAHNCQHDGWPLMEGGCLACRITYPEVLARLEKMGLPLRE
jgi:hypothetical protein